eukprot:353152-Chlamydomonas_euryale.AAC.1
MLGDVLSYRTLVHAPRAPPHVCVRAQVRLPGYRAFLEYMCPGSAARPHWPPAGSDPAACPRPVLGTYDDHDFGWNNGNGRMVRAAAGPPHSSVPAVFGGPSCLTPHPQAPPPNKCHNTSACSALATQARTLATPGTYACNTWHVCLRCLTASLHHLARVLASPGSKLATPGSKLATPDSKDATPGMRACHTWLNTTSDSVLATPG